MGQRIQIRIQAGKNGLQKRKKGRNYTFEELSVGLKASPGASMSFVGV
jgi:hypothetical protein